MDVRLNSTISTLFLTATASIELPDLPDESFDIITLTNVQASPLRSPLEFLNRAAVKLKQGGKIIATEPYFSVISTLIFKYLHHEPVDFSITKPELNGIRGPLVTANISIPWLIFVNRPRWCAHCVQDSTLTSKGFDRLARCYMATGGISRRLPIPTFNLPTIFSC